MSALQKHVSSVSAEAKPMPCKHCKNGIGSSVRPRLTGWPLEKPSHNNHVSKVSKKVSNKARTSELTHRTPPASCEQYARAAE
uniref:60S ribosomal protein L29 n=1 Tax=Haemonchus placei TaxID=6290 RepID=A0A0N4W5X4_HAEPC